MELLIFLYVVPFAIALAMPGWRSLAILGGIAGTWLAVQYADFHASTGNGFAMALAEGMLDSMAGGLASGVVTRAILLLLPKHRKTHITQGAIALVGLMVLPGHLVLEAWERRPPPEACMATRYPFEIEGITYSLSPDSHFTVWTDNQSLHLLGASQEVRALCRQTEGGSRPIHAVRIYIDMVRGAWDCSHPASDWQKKLCASDRKMTGDNGYPLVAQIYSPAELDHADHISFQMFQKSLARAKEDGTTIDVQRVGIFDKYSTGFLVAHDGAWKNEAGEPFTLECRSPTEIGKTNCSITYRLVSGPQITYQIYASPDKLERVARETDENLRAMIREMVRP